MFLPSISQRTPVNPAGQEHSKDDPLFEHVPPLKHGALAHGVPTIFKQAVVSRNLYITPLAHRQRIYSIDTLDTFPICVIHDITN